MLLQIWPWIIGGWLGGWLLGKISIEVLGWQRLLDQAWLRSWIVAGVGVVLSIASMSIWTPVVLAVLALVLYWAWLYGPGTLHRLSILVASPPGCTAMISGTVRSCSSETKSVILG